MQILLTFQATCTLLYDCHVRISCYQSFFLIIFVYDISTIVEPIAHIAHIRHSYLRFSFHCL